MQPGAIPESVVERYRKVLAMAERGEAGEQANAQRIVAKLEAEYPGIRVVALGGKRQRGTFVVPEGEPTPSVWEAAVDAANVAMGATDPWAMFDKYRQAWESATASLPPGTQLAELTDEEARELVVRSFRVQAIRGPLGTLRFRVDTPASVVSLLRGYSASEANREAICEAFGQLMSEWLRGSMMQI